jgi:hypothetical protein
MGKGRHAFIIHPSYFILGDGLGRQTEVKKDCLERKGIAVKRVSRCSRFSHKL